VELGAVALIGGEIFFGQNEGLAGEALTQGVERRSALAFLGTRARETGGVAAVNRSFWFLWGRMRTEFQRARRWISRPRVRSRAKT